MTIGDPTAMTTGPAAGAFGAFSPMAIMVHRGVGPVIGRQVELEAVRQELATSSTGKLTAITLEGEPGIGKTRLLLSACELATEAGFTAIAVTADEELRGPFVLARAIVGSPATLAAARDPESLAALTRCLDAMSGNDDPGLASLPADARLLRTYDLAAVALRACAAEAPIAILIDDLQWADDDSVRMIRYIVRSVGAGAIMLVFALRPSELAIATEAVNLIADLDRIGLVRRVKLGRFTPADTSALLAQQLGGPVDPRGAAVIHAQAEGVPFIVEELAQAYREGGMIQEIDGVWRLAAKADRLLPSAVRTLISRRAAHLPDETAALLSDAAVLGRQFSLKDLREIETKLGEREADDLARSLEPAVTAGLLIEHPEDHAADYSFQHEQVRDFCLAGLASTRRREIHKAIVELLLSGTPSAASLPLLAHHAMAAGDAAVCVKYSIEASRAALALPVAASSQERLQLLEVRDRALDMLRRPDDRLEGLAELSALAEALGDSHLQLDVRLRRAAALRVAGDEERAAALATEVRELAVTGGDRVAELAACLELGQDLVRAAAGEAYIPGDTDIDLEAAEEAFRRAAELAVELGDEPSAATANRETAVVLIGKIRRWFIEQVEMGAHIPLMQRVAAGEALEDMLPELPIAPLAQDAAGLLRSALERFEALGDRRGAMASIIAMAYLSWAPDIHLGSGAARHIEEIRRLTSRMKAFTNESERAAFEAQMLYGVNVFARAKVIPDLAISRGEEAFARAHEIGDRDLEFLAAGGTAMAHLNLGDTEASTRWLDRAATLASNHPTPLRARRMETWRGLVDAVAGDADGMRRHLQRAVELAEDARQPAARCEALARLGLEAARMGAERNDDGLLGLGEDSARAAAQLAAGLSGHPPWGAQAEAALARVALARGDHDAARQHALAATGALQAARHEDLELDVLIPAAEALSGTGAPEWEELSHYVSLSLAMVVQRTTDEDVRVRWLRGPVGRELTKLVGPIDATPTDGDDSVDDDDNVLLRSLVQGKTNREIADDLGIDEQAVSRRLAELYVRIGTTSRAEATAFAFQERIV
jgi:DNA-binding NarL/FixJ family response regulator